jgi:hypothetical protein
MEQMSAEGLEDTVRTGVPTSWIQHDDTIEVAVDPEGTVRMHRRSPRIPGDLPVAPSGAAGLASLLGDALAADADAWIDDALAALDDLEVDEVACLRDPDRGLDDAITVVTTRPERIPAPAAHATWDGPLLPAGPLSYGGAIRPFVPARRPRRRRT